MNNLSNLKDSELQLEKHFFHYFQHFFPCFLGLPLLACGKKDQFVVWFTVFSSQGPFAQEAAWAIVRKEHVEHVQTHRFRNCFLHAHQDVGPLGSAGTRGFSATHPCSYVSVCTGLLTGPLFLAIFPEIKLGFFFTCLPLAHTAFSICMGYVGCSYAMKSHSRPRLSIH